MNALRKTKIICTIGPATNTVEKIKELYAAGMNCARINCSHGTPNDRQPIVANLKKARNELNKPFAILLDTKGPEFRIKSFKNDRVTVKDGDIFTFTTDDIEGDNKKVSVTYKNLSKDLSVGDTILVNDGLVKFEVIKINKADIICKALIGGQLSNNKSMNFPDKNLSLDFLSDDDKEDLLFAIKNKIDFIACSFVSTAQDIKSVKEFLDDNGGSSITLLAKIENQSGVDNLDEICQHCDGILVARGDLGVEVDYDKLPGIQKHIIKKCKTFGKLAITCTEMLESMIEKPRPTRAEISDVANAVYDGTAALMLSGETAIGKYPIEAVEAMAKIAMSAEKGINYANRLARLKTKSNKRTVDAISHATCTIAVDVDAKGISNITSSGYTSKIISNFRPHVPICAITDNLYQFNTLALY